MSPGTLFLVPAPLDFGCEQQTDLACILPQHTIQTAAGLNHWICENAKSTRAYLKRIAGHVADAPSLQSLSIVELPRTIHKNGDHDGAFDATALLAPALQGMSVGLVCEAGMPALADPGASVVRTAHRLGVPVQPLVGPSSLFLALAASGLSGQSFAFAGYVPIEPAQRRLRLVELETAARSRHQSQIVIEAPYRNQALLDAMIQALRADTLLSMAAGLTLDNPLIRTAPIAQWRQSGPKIDNRIPTVFCIGM